jgi:hypothetical protein
MAFIEYACGHSTPVRGTGARVSRICATCAKDPHKAIGHETLEPGLGMLTLARILGHKPGEFPS